MDRPPALVAELIRSHLDRLAPAERRVAELVVADPEAVAYGTVASVAERAGTSGPTVVRFAARLGLSGFVELQRAVRAERSASEVRATTRLDGHHDDGFSGALARAARSVQEVLDAAVAADVDRAVGLLADPERSVVVMAASASAGIGAQAAASLDLLRPGVSSAAGDPLAVGLAVARLEHGDVVVVVDFPRYERWLLDALAAAIDAGAEVVGVSASPLSPIAAASSVAFTVPVAESGPFDSQVGALALLEALIAEVAVRTRATAARRVAAVEAAWDRLDLLAPEEPSS